jgi:hypothetical protein
MEDLRQKKISHGTLKAIKLIRNIEIAKISKICLLNFFAEHLGQSCTPLNNVWEPLRYVVKEISKELRYINLKSFLPVLGVGPD